MWKSLSHVQLFATPWNIQSVEFSRPAYWSGEPFPSPGDLPNPGIEPRSPALQVDSLPAEPNGKPSCVISRLKSQKSFSKKPCIFLDPQFPTLIWLRKSLFTQDLSNWDRPTWRMEPQWVFLKFGAQVPCPLPYFPSFGLEGTNKPSIFTFSEDCFPSSCCLNAFKWKRELKTGCCLGDLQALWNYCFSASQAQWLTVPPSR